MFDAAVMRENGTIVIARVPLAARRRLNSRVR
jgi:hypothetical protein